MSKNISEQRPTGSLRVRQNFAKIPQVIDIPNLIEIQKKSFELFLQGNVAPGRREQRGLEEVFRDVFPISDLNKTRRFDMLVWRWGPGNVGAEIIQSWAVLVWYVKNVDKKLPCWKSISCANVGRKD